MASFISNTVNSIPPSGIRRFFDLIMSMEDVLSLGVGEPDFVTPWHIRRIGVRSLEDGYTSYTSNLGLAELRERVAENLKRKFDLNYSPEKEILITVGVSEGLDLALRAILNPCDEVIIPQPCYVSYKPCTVLAGGRPIELSTTETEFKVTAEAIEAHITPKTKALILSYPCNPTGATLDRDELLKIAEVVEKHNLIVISDEIYGELTYDGPHIPFASLPGMRDRTVLLNGFSKAYAMTGWRVGYACSTEEIIGAMTKIHQYTILCAPIMSQFAAIEALTNGEEEVFHMRQSYDQRRRLITAGLNQIGLPCTLPKGAFYVFPSIKHTGLSSEEFTERLLLEEKVAVVPGSAFGDCGEGYIRCVYAVSVKKIEEALERMERFLKRCLGI